MEPKRISSLTISLVLLAQFLPAQEAKPFLTPAEVIKVMGESKTQYGVHSLETLKPEELKDLTGLLFRQVCPDVTDPRVISEGGRPAVKPYVFKKRAVELTKQGEACYLKREYDKAREFYEEALKDDPDCYLVVAFIGDTHLFTGHVEEALAAYDKAVLMNPYDHRLHFFRGHALLEAGRAEDAKRNIIRALALRPRYKYLLNAVNSEKKPYGFAVRESIFQPPVLVRKEGKAIGIYVDPKDKLAACWTAYACAKALWIGEPGHRREMLGNDRPGWSTTEERECMGNLMAVYADLLEKKEIQPDAGLEVLKRVVEEGDMDGFMLYEAYSRLCPSAMLTIPEEHRELVERYIEKYLIIPQS